MNNVNQLLGITHCDDRKSGVHEEFRFAVGPCSLGSVLVATTKHGICAIFLGDDPSDLVRNVEKRFPHADLIGADDDLTDLLARVVDAIDYPQASILLPLDVRGTAFEQRVWQALQKIPSGKTASYAEVARSMGAPTSARAVAQACGQNPLAIAIPCHRVLRSDGSISGYRWGVERKRALLAREATYAKIYDDFRKTT